MSYTALYRKYRPAGFESVKGQDHIVKTLKNQILADRIGHAYLFCGTRGTGKTTIAKIFARAVNCTNNTDGSPCGECESCKAIAAGRSANVIEMDAASNNGVDDIRNIVEEISYPPVNGKYKVYIIDEVHMLTPNAFNALLKTLEEPPSYVIFILATTEYHKIPITILSRCQKYDFRRISIDTISERLKELMEAEGIEIEEKAVRYIAKAADGSMRDALSLLDQCIAFYMGENLTFDKVLEVLGAVDTDIFATLLDAIIEGRTADAITVLDEMVIEGRELNQFVVDFIWYLRNLLLIHSNDDVEDVLDISGDNLLVLKAQAEQLDSNTIIRYIRIFSQLSADLKYATQKRVLIEIALIKLCNPAMNHKNDELAERVSHIERQLERGIAVSCPTPSVSSVPATAAPVKKPVLEKAMPDDIREVAQNWGRIIESCDGYLKGVVRKAMPSLGDGDVLLLVFEDEMTGKLLDTDEHRAELKNIIGQVTEKEVNLRVEVNNTNRPARETYIDITNMENLNFDGLLIEEED